MHNFKIDANANIFCLILSFKTLSITARWWIAQQMHFSVYEIEGGALFTSHFVNVYSAQSTYTAQSCFTAAAVLVKIKKTVYLRSHPCKRSISWICISDTCRQLCVQTGGHIFFFLAIVKTILCKSIGIMHLYMNCIAVNRSVCCNITEPNSNKCWAAQQSFLFFNEYSQIGFCFIDFDSIHIIGGNQTQQWP